MPGYMKIPRLVFCLIGDTINKNKLQKELCGNSDSVFRQTGCLSRHGHQVKLVNQE
jgi:hypothetical protein